jgi:hypothetical protein
VVSLIETVDASHDVPQIEKYATTWLWEIQSLYHFQINVVAPVPNLLVR